MLLRISMDVESPCRFLLAQSAIFVHTDEAGRRRDRRQVHVHCVADAEHDVNEQRRKRQDDSHNFHGKNIGYYKIVE